MIHHHAHEFRCPLRKQYAPLPEIYFADAPVNHNKKESVSFDFLDCWGKKSLFQNKVATQTDIDKSVEIQG